MTQTIVDVTQGTTYKCRPHVVEISSITKNKKQQRARRRALQDKNPPVRNIPLEMQPVLRAVLNYGKMTGALGIKKGADELAQIINKIRELKPEGPIREILDEADNTVKKLNEAYVAGYSGN